MCNNYFNKLIVVGTDCELDVFGEVIQVKFPHNQRDSDKANNQSSLLGILNVKDRIRVFCLFVCLFVCFQREVDIYTGNQPSPTGDTLQWKIWPCPKGGLPYALGF